MRLFPVIFSCVVLAGCSGDSGHEDCHTGHDTEADADADADADTDADVDTALWSSEISGSAAVAAGTSWMGTEYWEYTDVTNNVTACLFEMTTRSVTPLTTCSDCTFAFETKRFNGVGLSGDCAGLGLADQSGDMSMDFGFGFAPTYTASYGYDYTNVLMYYYAPYSMWVRISGDNGAYYDTATGQFDYEIMISYFYYYAY